MTNSKARDLSSDQKALVATALFGTEQALAAVERLDPDGDLQLGTPWPQAPFEAALTREVTACKGTDTTAERERRRRAYAARRASVRVHDDGTGTFSVRGPLHKILAAHARHDDVARSLRAAGHPDSLARLAADSVLATLTHGTLDPTGGTDIDELSETDLDDLIAVVNGHARIALQVIVPADVLGPGHPVCATCATDLTPREGTRLVTDPAMDDDQHDDHGGGTPTTGSGEATDDFWEGQEPRLPFEEDDAPPSWASPTRADQSTDNDRIEDAGDAGHCVESPPGEPDPPPGTDPQPGTTPSGADRPLGEEPRPGANQRMGADRRPGADLPPQDDSSDSDGPAGGSTGQAGWGYDPELRRGRGKVAEIIGTHPAFITPGQARELFYTPGTTLHRLLTDPADGRCIERTISSYRPDTDMRRQVRAADVYSRHPHSRSTGRHLEIDHVIPFSAQPDPDHPGRPDGPAGRGPGGATTETNLANLDLRNHKIKTARELMITINTGRDLTFTTLLGQITRSRAHDYRQYLRTAHPEDLEDQADLANTVLYAALANRPEHRYRPGPDTWLTLDHTDPSTGQTHPGPPQQPHDPYDLLGITHDDHGNLDDPDSESSSSTGTHDG